MADPRTRERERVHTASSTYTRNLAAQKHHHNPIITLLPIYESLNCTPAQHTLHPSRPHHSRLHPPHFQTSQRGGCGAGCRRRRVAATARVNNAHSRNCPGRILRAQDEYNFQRQAYYLLLNMGLQFLMIGVPSSCSWPSASPIARCAAWHPLPALWWLGGE